METICTKCQILFSEKQKQNKTKQNKKKNKKKKTKNKKKKNTYYHLEKGNC